MSDEVLVAAIMATAPTILAVVNLIHILRLKKDTKNLQQDVNGRLSRLLDETAARNRAEGELSAVRPPPPERPKS